MNARLLGSVFALCGAVVVVVLVGTGLGWWSSTPLQAAPVAPLAVQTAVTPSVIFFGDPLVARVTIALDRSTVSPGTLRVEPSFEPFVASAAPEQTRVRAGRLETVQYTYSLQCVTDGCLPTKSSLTVNLPRVVVTALAGTKRLSVSQKWPPIVIVSRLQQSSHTAAKFRVGPALPAVSYATSPSRLADILVAFGALVAAVALILLGLELRSASRRRRERISRTRLAAAVAYVRESAQRDPADRRKALEGLAEALVGEGEPDLAESAGRLAWAEPQPTPEGALALAETIEATPETGET